MNKKRAFPETSVPISFLLNDSGYSQVHVITDSLGAVCVGIQ